MSIQYIQSIKACAAHYGDQSEAMEQYLVNGHNKAISLQNRGPIAFDEDGQLAQHILDAYSKYGFYIFQDVIDAREMSDIKNDIEALRKRFPTSSSSKLDANNQPAIGHDNKGPNLFWAKPLSDPLGGSPIANGRHQVKLFEPEPTDKDPAEVPFILLGSLQHSEACLRTYAHPKLLKVAAAINGADFAPFHECLFIKEPKLGAAVSWHQDGDTHWQNPDFEEGIHGFNFMAQVYGSTAVNGVWVIPGTHKLGKMDIKKMIADTGSERLEDAVPLICDAGDVVMCNRQIVHGSFANTGFEPRITINFGFHKRSSVLNVMGAGIHAEAMEFTEELIARRAAVIGYGIDARHKQYPDEAPYQYQPHEEAGEQFEWNVQAKEAIKDYNLIDLSI